MNDPNRIAPGIADASATEHEQTERLQPSTQENGTPTGTINEDINPDDTREHKADAATVQMNNQRRFEPENQAEDVGYEGED